jgi:hypothetical protein
MMRESASSIGTINTLGSWQLNGQTLPIALRHQGSRLMDVWLPSKAVAPALSFRSGRRSKAIVFLVRLTDRVYSVIANEEAHDARQ